MARHTFFSFHYERDVWRAGQVRNSWVTKDRDAAGFWDKAKWEEVKKKGAHAIHEWIDDQLSGTSVTVVLIGAETSAREYVEYEITESHRKRNGMFGIYIHNMKDSESHTDTKGRNPFDKCIFKDPDDKVMTYPTYDWANGDGRANMGEWIETAARRAGR
jgi:hypothetical protein